MQIQYNITRIEEWCKSHDMPEGTLQLEHLMQATKLLQLKKDTTADIEIIYDVCCMLSPMQIQRMCANYHVADFEVRPPVPLLCPCSCSYCTLRRRSRRRSCAWSRRK
jgi:myosin heavy subunit